MAAVLRYKGPGYFDGVPAQDLTADDIRDLPPEWTAAQLVESGKYTRVGGGASDALAEADKAHTAAVKAVQAEPTKRGG